MTNRFIGVALFAALLMLASVAAAEADRGDTSPSSDPRPDDAAWVEDCPPDMMCAASGDTTDGNVSRGPEDCDHCRDHQGNDCVDCLGAPGEQDDTTWGTDCPPGVYCMVDGETEDPADAGWVDCGGEVCAFEDDRADPKTDGDAETTAEASALGAAVLLATVGLTLGAFAASTRRSG